MPNYTQEHGYSFTQEELAPFSPEDRKLIQDYGGTFACPNKTLELAKEGEAYYKRQEEEMKEDRKFLDELIGISDDDIPDNSP